LVLKKLVGVEVAEVLLRRVTVFVRMWLMLLAMHIAVVKMWWWL
jgi:hypothetical protein